MTAAGKNPTQAELKAIIKDVDSTGSGTVELQVVGGKYGGNIRHDTWHAAYTQSSDGQYLGGTTQAL
jgi:hypothetical protein